MDFCQHHHRCEFDNMGDNQFLFTMQYDKIEVWRPWVLTTIATSAAFVSGVFIYGLFSGIKKGDAAMQPCT